MYLTLTSSMLYYSVKFLSQPTKPHLSPLYVSLSASRVTNHASPTPVFSISSPLFQVPYTVSPVFAASMRNAPLSIFSYKHVFLFCAHDCLGGASPSSRFPFLAPPVSFPLFISPPSLFARSRLLHPTIRASCLPPS